MKLTFGKYKGWELTEVPTEYLEWGANHLDSEKWSAVFQKELKLRAEQEVAQITKWKQNIGTPDTKEQLFQKFLAELKTEAQESGCEWEYDNFNFWGEAENMANEYIAELKREIKIDELRAEYISEEGLTLEILKKIEEVNEYPGLSRSQFSTGTKYELAIKYIEALNQI